MYIYIYRDIIFIKVQQTLCANKCISDVNNIDVIKCDIFQPFHSPFTVVINRIHNVVTKPC